jgi:hypothetical protein
MACWTALQTNSGVSTRTARDGWISFRHARFAAPRRSEFRGHRRLSLEGRATVRRPLGVARLAPMRAPQPSCENGFHRGRRWRGTAYSDATASLVRQDARVRSRCTPTLHGCDVSRGSHACARYAFGPCGKKRRHRVARTRWRKVPSGACTIHPSGACKRAGARSYVLG